MYRVHGMHHVEVLTFCHILDVQITGYHQGNCQLHQIHFKNCPQKELDVGTEYGIDQSEWDSHPTVKFVSMSGTVLDGSTTAAHVCHIIVKTGVNRLDRPVGHRIEEQRK